MKILRAVGLGLAIIVLKFLAPPVYSGLEETILAFLEALQEILAMDNRFLPANLPSVSGM